MLSILTDIPAVVFVVIDLPTTGELTVVSEYSEDVSLVDFVTVTYYTFVVFDTRFVWCLVFEGVNVNLLN